MKHTTSICPNCDCIIEAYIYEQNNEVFMKKECPIHGHFEGLFERDVEFCKESLKSQPGGFVPHKLFIVITHRCKFDCTGCYVSKEPKKDLTLEEFKEIVNRRSNTVSGIIISGGELTLHPQFFDMVRYCRSLNLGVNVATTGMEFTGKFLEEFKENSCGVSLSYKGKKVHINSLNLDKNLCLQVTIVKNETEHFIKDVIEIALAKDIHNVRIRSMLSNDARTGVSQNIDQLFVSDLLNITAEQLDLPKNYFKGGTHHYHSKYCFDYEGITLSFFSWFDKFNIDYSLIGGSQIEHYTQDGIVPFPLALFKEV